MNESIKTMNPVKGQVIRTSADGKTAKVEVASVVIDNRYGKRLKRSIFLTADSSGVEVSVGMSVGLLPARRVSKTKSWRVVRSPQG